MDGRRLVTAGVALACVVALAMAAATFDSTVQTDPDDEINLSSEHLPLGEEKAEDIEREVQGGSQGDTTSGGGENAGTGASGSGGQGDEEQSQSQSSESGQSGGETGGQASGGGSGDSSSGGAGSGAVGQRGWLDRLLSWLADLLPWLALLAGLLVALALLRRYGDRLAALALALLPEEREGGSAPAERWEPEPSDDVQRAWVALVERAGVDRPWAKTPGECARAAVDAGFDSERVERLRHLFEEVRYGGRPATEARVRSAREQLDGLGIGGDAP